MVDYGKERKACYYNQLKNRKISNFSKYRDKLIKMKLLKSSANTFLEFNLPRFEMFAMMNRNLDIEI